MTRIAYTTPEAVQIAARRHLSAAVRLALHATQDGKCAGCKTPLTPGWNLDHRLALALGGADQPHNWQALCVPCHAIKTKSDIKAIAKCNRIVRDSAPETRKRSARPIPSRPFPKSPQSREQTR